MTEILILISIAALLLAMFLSRRAHDALLRYLPPQFNDAEQWWAHEGMIFERRIPLSIQLDVVCAQISFCLASAGFLSAGLINWQNSSAHDRVGYLLLGAMLAAVSLRLFASIKKYRSNRHHGTRPNGVSV